MSSYIKKCKNPKTGKIVKAFFIDDYYGSHQYGIGFRKDGKDANLKDLNSSLKDCEFYPVMKEISTSEYNKEIDKIIKKRLPVEDTLIEMLETASKYKLK